MLYVHTLDIQDSSSFMNKPQTPPKNSRHFNNSRMIKVQKTLIHLWWECKTAQLHWKTVWQILTK